MNIFKEKIDFNLKLLYYLTKFTTNYELNENIYKICGDKVCGRSPFIKKLLDIFKNDKINNPLYVIQQFILNFYKKLSYKWKNTKEENLNVLITKEREETINEITKKLNPIPTTKKEEVVEEEVDEK